MILSITILFCWSIIVLNPGYPSNLWWIYSTTFLYSSAALSVWLVSGQLSHLYWVSLPQNHSHAAYINTPIKTRSLHNHRGSFMLVLLAKAGLQLQLTTNTCKVVLRPGNEAKAGRDHITTAANHKHLQRSHLMPSRATVPQLGNACSYGDSLTKVATYSKVAYAISLTSLFSSVSRVTTYCGLTIAVN